LAGLLGAVLAAGLLAGCSSSGSDGTGSGGTGFVSGQGAITSLPVSQRQRPGPVAGETLDGSHVALSDYRGKVVVVNVWGSWCAPCRAEAPVLVAAAKHLSGKGVAFLGINSRDLNEAAARAFVRTFHVPYPSIYDQDGSTLLAFRGTLTPNAIPSTVIIDPQGRVAGSVLGEVSRTTLDDLVHDARYGPPSDASNQAGQGAARGGGA
jgi:thiol-disulfide isomerase/thioredoxin